MAEICIISWEESEQEPRMLTTARHTPRLTWSKLIILQHRAFIQQHNPAVSRQRTFASVCQSGGRDLRSQNK